MKKRVIYSALAFALCGTFAVANETKTYTQNYSVNSVKNSIPLENDNRFMQGNFDKIYRFEMVAFDEDSIREDSKPTLQKIMQKVHELESQKKEFSITLTSHTEETTDDKNENSIQSQSYANSIQSLFQKEFSQEDALHLSKQYAKRLQEELHNNGVAKEHIFVEYRAAEDTVLTEIDDDDKELSHGVFVAIYEISKKITPPTPHKSTVQPEPKASPMPVTTPPPPPETLDSDNDGVEDAKDECKRTPQGVRVDIHGCPLKSTLKLNFAVNSADILENSQAEIDRFAAFLKENPLYHAEITGHTDSRGKDVLNMKLSQNRALSTKSALVKAGVEPSRLTTKGRGELDPIASNLSAEGREANRRIEVELFLKK